MVVLWWCYCGLMGFSRIDPLVICYIAIEHDHRNSDFPVKIVIFHSFIKLPEGRTRTCDEFEYFSHQRSANQ